jgi:phosphoglycolate phosphatase
VKPTVVLIDIDGTLLSTGGAGKRAMAGAFESICGHDPCDFSFAGMTDRAIARTGLSRAGTPVTEDAIDALIEAYLARLAAEVARAEVKFCAGMEGALALLEAAPHVAMGLGTGNVRAGARLKVGRVTTFERFAFGGFGCDAEDRIALLRRGAERGAERLGKSIDACRVVVVGDTPKDVAAAHGFGAESIAVATGSFSVDALAACKPTFTFATLGAEGASVALLGDG